MTYKTRITLKEIKIQNFKSFKNVNMKLEDFNVLIGTNASGKSNFVQVFNFLRDIHKHGLKNAISLQGGVEFIRNFKIGSGSNLVFEIRLDFSPYVNFFRHSPYPVRVLGLDYRFELQLGKRSGFQIAGDRAIFSCEIGKKTDPRINDTGSITVTNNSGKTTLVNDLGLTSNHKLLDPFLRYNLSKLPKKSLLLESILFSRMMNPNIFSFMDTISVYDFDPKLAKKAVHLIGKNTLEPDGSNLAIILKNIGENGDLRRKFSNLIKELLPFVEDVNTENHADKSILFNVRENHFKGRQLPSNLISDGTINITALIIVLYFQNNGITILEEPERNIHPSLITKIVKMMQDAASAKQVLVTTHNPEMVKYAGIDNIHMITRDGEGFSHIVKPSGSDSVKQFLKNEMEIGELYVQNLLD